MQNYLLFVGLNLFFLSACGRNDSPPANTHTLTHLLPTATVTLVNPSAGVVDFLVTDSTGHSSPVSLSARKRADVRVGVGKVTVRSTPRDRALAPITQVIDLRRGKNQSLPFSSGVTVRPSQISATIGGVSVDHGIFECANGPGVSYDSQARLGKTYFTLGCKDPRSSVVHSFQAVFDSTQVQAGLPPEPLKTCAQSFKTFQTTRLNNYFKMRFSKYGIDCQTGLDVTTVAVDGSSAVGGGIIDLASPLTSSLSTPTSYGTLTFQNDDNTFDTGTGNFTTVSTYLTNWTIAYGNLDNSLKFRYQFPADDSAEWVTHFKLQMSLTNNSKATTLSPCYQWDQPDGLVSSFDLDAGIPAIQLSGGVWEQRFFHTFKHLPQQTTIFLRAIPLGDDGKCIGGPSTWAAVHVDQGEAPSLGDIFQAAKDKLDAQKAAELAKTSYFYSLVGYTPPVFGANQDGNFHMIVTKGNPNNWPGGCGYIPQWPPEDEPWYKKLVGAFSSALDFIASVYNDIKAAVIDYIVTILPYCNDTCKAAVTAGIDVGLAAVGLPPTLPNSAELMAAGNGYVAGLMADAVSDSTGGVVPASLVLPAANSLSQQVSSAGVTPNYSDNDQFTWGKDDPFYKDRPAVAWVRVNRDPDPTKEFGRSFSLSSFGPSGEIWERVDLDVPKSLKPGESMLIPIVLKPHLVDLNETQSGNTNHDNAVGRWFKNSYQYGNASMSMSGPGITYHGGVGVQFGPYGILNPAPVCQ